MNSIQTSMLDTVLTITFNNKSPNPPRMVTWVCADRAAYDQALASLTGQDWIEILAHGNSHVQRAK